MRAKYILTPVKKKFIEDSIEYIENEDWDNFIQLAVISGLTKNQLMDVILLILDECDIRVPDKYLVKIREVYTTA